MAPSSRAACASCPSPPASRAGRLSSRCASGDEDERGPRPGVPGDEGGCSCRASWTRPTRSTSGRAARSRTRAGGVERGARARTGRPGSSRRGRRGRLRARRGPRRRAGPTAPPVPRSHLTACRSLERVQEFPRDLRRTWLHAIRGRAGGVGARPPATATPSPSPHSCGPPSATSGGCAPTWSTPQSADDLAQDTYVRALGALPQLRGPRAVPALAAEHRPPHLRRRAAAPARAAGRCCCACAAGTTEPCPDRSGDLAAVDLLAGSTRTAGRRSCSPRCWG